MSRAEEAQQIRDDIENLLCEISQKQYTSKEEFNRDIARATELNQRYIDFLTDIAENDLPLAEHILTEI